MHVCTCNTVHIADLSLIKMSQYKQKINSVLSFDLDEGQDGQYFSMLKVQNCLKSVRKWPLLKGDIDERLLSRR